ncbi:MAG: DUF3596 domain-containing protein [Microcoleaceae cyanobacterium]
MGQTKAQKGTVVVFADNGCLRLRWRYQGKRKSMSIGLPDTKVNRILAEGLARKIELDIKAGNYDPTRAKYRPNVTEPSSMTIPELFEQFLKIKSKSITARSVEKYTAALKYLEKFHGNKIHNCALAKPCGSSIASIQEKPVEKFYDWFIVKKLEPITIKERLSCIREVWAFAVEKSYLIENLGESIPNRVTVPPKQKPKPFTVEEVKTIISGFRNNRYYSYYTDYQVPTLSKSQAY